MKWVQSYLSYRSHTTKINETFSSEKHLKCGVPQGSVLGTTLFLIYINDLSKIFKTFSAIFYADDTTLFVENANLNSILPQINEDLDALHKWCVRHKLTINFSKSNFMVLKNPQNNFKILPSSILINNFPLEQATNIKFLGIVIDQHLSFSAHIDYLIRRLRPITGLFYRLSSFISHKLLIMLYHSLINSRLCYCIESYGTSASVHLNRLLKFQKMIMRVIHRKPPQTHTKPLFKVDKILQIQNLYKFKVLQIAHTFYHSITQYSASSITTRQSKNIFIPLFRTSAGQKAITYQQSTLWNGLPNHLRLIESPKLFKKNLKMHLLT